MTNIPIMRLCGQNPKAGSGAGYCETADCLLHPDLPGATELASGCRDQLGMTVLPNLPRQQAGPVQHHLDVAVAVRNVSGDDEEALAVTSDVVEGLAIFDAQV
jgi:hypothetical protein